MPEHYSVQFLGPGWVELPPGEPARPIELDDWRVLKAKEEGKKFFQGNASAPASDQQEIERLRAEFTTAAEKKEKAATDQLKARDARIAELEKNIRDAQNAPQAPVAPYFAQWRGFVRKYPVAGGGLTAGLGLLLLLFILFAVYGLDQYWQPATPQNVTAVTGSGVPADYGSVKSDVADLKAKMAAKEAAEQALAESLKNRKPLPALLPFDPDTQ